MHARSWLAIALLTWPTALWAADSSPAPKPAPSSSTTLWITADRLLPGWGFWTNGATYGGTPSLGKGSAWTCSGGAHGLVWVADVPTNGTYQVWVRQYGGYGKVELAIDERPVAGGRGGPGGGRYVWRHLGETSIAQGSHHLDMTVQAGMLDAVLLTLDPGLRPNDASLPPPVAEPKLRALRAYRNDDALATAAAARGFVVGRVAPYAEIRYDWLPRANELLDRVSLWGSARQYVSGTLAIRALRPIEELRVTLDALAGPGGAKIGPGEIDLRIVHLRNRSLTFHGTGAHEVEYPDLLLRDDRTSLPPKGDQGGYGGGACVTSIPAHQARQVWMTVHFPADARPGTYRGRIGLAPSGRPQDRLEIPVEIEVLPIELKPVDGYYSIYYPSQPANPDRPNHVSIERYRAELADQVRHGLNATTLYGSQTEILPEVVRAGMTRSPCLMHWPDSRAKAQIEEARRLGLEGLLFYGVDEPHTPEAIERCRKEAERRQKAGLPMFTAINNHPAQQALRDWVSHPVYVSYHFDGPGNAEVAYVKQKGFQPVSYWTTGMPFPLYYRVLSGLYNTACGFQGTAPWAYQDYPDDRLYTKPAHAVSYPDAAGRPIPTLRWEAFRDGVDDVRYLQALDRALAVADARLKEPTATDSLRQAVASARKVRAEQYESIRGRWFTYMFSIQPGDLDRSRRSLAEATAALGALR